MTAEQIEYVQHSFDQIRPLENHLGVMFYRRLFELDPTLRPLFKGDLHAQSRKFTQVLGTVVAHLHRTEDILPAVRDLGRRHAVYGVRAALLWALERNLGPAFTPAVGAAWQSGYTLLSGAMQAAPTEKQPSCAIGSPTGHGTLWITERAVRGGALQNTPLRRLFRVPPFYDYHLHPRPLPAVLPRRNRVYTLVHPLVRPAC